MYVTFDHQQTSFLRELLQRSLEDVRTENVRTDSRDYRAMLHGRERMIEQLLSKLSDETQPVLG